MGNSEQLHFKAADQDKLLTCGHNHSTTCLKATLCLLDHGCRPKYTHSGFYDHKVSILLLVPSQFPCSPPCWVLRIPSPRSFSPSQHCSLPPLLPPSCFKACYHYLLPCFSATSPSQWFSSPFGPLVRFSLITRLPLPLFSCFPDRTSFPCLLSFLALAPT